MALSFVLIWRLMHLSSILFPESGGLCISGFHFSSDFRWANQKARGLKIAPIKTNIKFDQASD